MISLCTLIVAACMSSTVAPPSPKQTADALVFRKPLSAFISAADSPTRDTRLNWTTDGCSVPVIGSSGRSFDFLNACRRHDFAYRNYQRIDGGKHWGTALRSKVDNLFLKDMRADCAKRTANMRVTCRSWADLFYSAVRTYAGP